MTIQEKLKQEVKKTFEIESAHPLLSRSEKRVFQIESFRAGDTGTDSENIVELSFSSDKPALMYGMYYETLSHEDGAVDLTRLESAAPLLYNHDFSEQIGVVESAYIQNGKGFARVRFSKEEKPQSILRDVKDKIRLNVSVGYSVTAYEQTGEQDGFPVFRSTKWQPMEISIVSVPADPTVGVGRRSLDTGEHQGENPPPVEKKEEAPQNTNIEVLINEVRKQMTDQAKTEQDLEQKRITEILDMGIAYKCSERAAKAVKEGMPSMQFQSLLCREFADQANRPLEDVVQDAGIGLSKKEVEQFSIMKVVRALADPNNSRLQEAAKLEFEASNAARQKFGKENTNNFVLPAEVSLRIVNTSTAGTTGNTGGYGIKKELRPESFIEILRNKTTITQIASSIGGLVGNVDIPKQVTASQGYWVAENADATEQTPDLGLITLTPKTVAAFTDITRKMMVQDSIGIENLVMSDLAKALALTIDKAAYYGSGSSNQPLGLANISGISSDEIAGTYPTYAELVAMESDIGEDNADVDNMYYLGNAKWRGALKTSVMFSGTASPIFQADRTVNGYKTLISNQIVEGDTFLGNFSDFIVASWGAFELMTDPYTGSKSGKLRLVAFHDVDFAVRHPQSFAMYTVAA